MKNEGLSWFFCRMAPAKKRIKKNHHASDLYHIVPQMCFATCKKRSLSLINRDLLLLLLLLVVISQENEIQKYVTYFAFETCDTKQASF